MLDVTPVGWAVTIAVIAAVFTLDLVMGVRRAHTIGFREAVAQTLFYVGIAVLFGIGFGIVAGWEHGTAYFAGWIVEMSLSVDNVFVFVIIISTFAVPARHERHVLSIGILLALALRAVFIALGAALLAAFSGMFLVFGVALLLTALQLFRHRDEDPTVDDNLLVRLARRVLPVTEEYDEGRLVTHREGRRMFTPMLVALIAIGSTDVLFALDSIPAVFGVTDQGFIVFAANAFALIGLRAMYFLVSGLLDRLVYLSTGLSLVLGFIGVKLVLHFGHEQSTSIPEIPVGASLLIIVAILAATTLLSLRAVRRDPSIRAHAGRVVLRDDDGRPVEDAG